MKKFYFVLLVLTIQFITNSNKLLGQTYIQAQTGYYTNESHYSWQEEWYKINDTIKDRWTCCGTSDALKIAVFDSATCEPWISPGIGMAYFLSNGSYHCLAYDEYAFDFFISDNDSTLDVITNFINSIPQNDYVLVMTHKNHHCQEWDDSLINAFRTIGSSIDTNNRIPDNYPYIIFGYKGAIPGSVNQVTGNASGDLILLSDSMPCNPSSITEISTYNDISFFPNPTSGNLTIVVPQKATIEITNVNGQIIKTNNIVDKKITIDLGNLSRGVYIASVRTDNKIVTKRIIKE